MGCNYDIEQISGSHKKELLIKAVAKTENTGLFIQSEENTAVLFEFNSPLFSVLKYNWLLKCASSDCVIFYLFLKLIGCQGVICLISATKVVVFTYNDQLLQSDTDLTLSLLFIYVSFCCFKGAETFV